MKPSHLTNLLALFVVLALAAVSIAGVPQTINYQGYLTTTGGVPASGPLAMTFSLYSSNPARNNPVWRETQPAVAVTNGIYSTRLGSVTPITAPFDVSYWLGVKVAGDGEMALQPLSSTPYTLRAGVADSVNSGNQLVTTVPTGTAPLSVTSTTAVPNLNADMVDGKHADDIVAAAATTIQPAVNNLQTQISGIAAKLPITQAWGVGTKIGAGYVGFPQVAGNPSGYAVAAWMKIDEPFSDIEVNYYVPGSGWDTPQKILGRFAKFPQTVIDANGNAMVVYLDRDPQGINEQLLFIRKTPITGWSSSQPVNTVAANTQYDHRIAIDPSGNVVAVWTQQQQAGGPPDVWASRYVNGIGWGTSQLLESNTIDMAMYPQVAMDNSGNAIAVWQQYDLSMQYTVWASRYVVGTGWGSPQSLATNGNNPRIVMDGTGNAIAIWSQSDGVWYNRFDKTNGWGVSQLFIPGVWSSAKVAVDASGNALALWPHHDGTVWSILSSRYVPGIGWGASQSIGVALGNSHVFTADDVQIAMNASGNAIAVGLQYESNRSDIWSVRYTPDIGWGSVQMVETDNSTSAGGPLIVLDASGNAIAFWGQNWGYWANHSTLSQSLTLPNTSNTFSTSLIAPSSSNNRTVTLPDVSGKIITTGNLTDITSVGTIYNGDWQGTPIPISKGGTGHTNAADARFFMEIPGLNTPNTFVSTQTVKTGSTLANGLIVQGVQFQAGHLQEWQDHMGNRMAAITASGKFMGDGSQLNNISVAPTNITGTIPISKGGTGADNAAGARNSLAVPGLSGSNNFISTQTVQTGSAFEKGLVVQGAAGQSANLQEWLNSSGATVASVSPTGVFSGNGSGLTNISPADSSVTSAKIESGAVTDSKISGTISDSRLSANVALLDSIQTFSNLKTFTDWGLLMRNSANTFSTTLKASNATANRFITLPDNDGTVITTNNLTSIDQLGTINSGTWNGTIISPQKGGTGFNLAAALTGSLLRTTAPDTWGLLNPGVEGTVLKMTGGAPAWGSTGTVTSIAAGTGLTATPSPITTSGTIAIDTAVVPRMNTMNTFAVGNQTIQTGGAGNMGMVIRGAAGQLANLQGWQDGTGSPVASVSATGVFTGNGSGLTNITPADSSITSAKILNGTIAQADMANNSIGTAQIIDASVSDAKISGVISSAKLSSHSGDVTGTHAATTVAGIQGRAVSATAPATGDTLVYNGSSWVPTANLKPVSAHNLTGTTVVIGSTCTNYMSVSITVPAAGTVAVEATNFIRLNHTNGTEDIAYIFVGNSLSDCGDNYGVWAGSVPASTASGTVNQTASPRNVFTVSSAGTYTYYLNGLMSPGADALDRFWYARMFATYYPN